MNNLPKSEMTDQIKDFVSTFKNKKVVATFKSEIKLMNKTDNRIENLEWCTNSENQIHLPESIKTK